MAEFVPGVELGRALYQEVVASRLHGLRHSAARLGTGSDVLGYDTARSTDHDWGARLDVLVEAGDPEPRPVCRPGSGGGRPRWSWSGSAPS